jgi:leader peptidase (prepilin peptidase) / N-methyltransferase
MTPMAIAVPRALSFACLGATIALVSSAPVLSLEALALSVALGGLAGAIAEEDWRSYRVRDCLSAAVLALGLVAALVVKPHGAQHWTAAFLLAFGDAVLCGTAMLLVRMGYRRAAGIEGMGLGDVKLAAAAGPWVGWMNFPWVVLIASLAALVYVGFLSLAGGAWPRGRRIPFAAFLAPALWFAWVVLVV